MTQPNRDYTITSQVHINNLNEDGTVTPGFQVVARDALSGVSFPVFVPDAQYTAEGVDMSIRHLLDRVREVHRLGES